jgi:hypothetical protein
MSGLIKQALPAHMKPASANGGNGEEAFKRKHHGKTQSHMVSSALTHHLFSLSADCLHRPNGASEVSLSVAPGYFWSHTRSNPSL